MKVKEYLDNGYLIAFHNEYVYLYHSISNLCVRAKVNTCEKLEKITTFEPCKLPENAHVELWSNGIREAKQSMEWVRREYGELLIWKDHKEHEKGLELKLSLNLTKCLTNREQSPI